MKFRKFARDFVVWGIATSIITWVPVLAWRFGWISSAGVAGAIVWAGLMAFVVVALIGSWIMKAVRRRQGR